MMKKLLKIVLLLCLAGPIGAQAVSLPEVVNLARQQSLAARKAGTLKTTRYWEWRSFQANYRPQITWSGVIPGFSRTSLGITQNDGTIKFQSISQNYISTRVSLSQQITATGGTLFVSTVLERFDDLKDDFTSYNGVPLEFGISQPFFGFNALKWDKKIEPLRYGESQREFIVEMEEIAVTATDYFFNLLLAQVDYSIAQTNVANTDTIYRITEEKFEMGKISRNDLLQLKLQKLKAEKALALAEQNLETAELHLRSYVGYRQAGKWQLALPSDVPEILIPEETALLEARNNRPDALAFQRRLLEARRDIALAKSRRGFSAGLYGTLGFAKTAETIGGVYQNPPDQQTIALEFSIPIVDWGRSKAQLETARANQQLVQNEIEQDSTDFEQTILTELTLFRQYFRQLALNAEVDELAQARYQIAQDRFILGNLSITDLIIALQEKDQSQRDYVRSLWDYWRSYYRIRALTLYDFTLNQKINY